MKKEKEVSEVTLKIKSCTECPHFSSERDYTADSFEFVTRWDCKKGDTPKNIRRYVDWTDHRKFIPTWCPLKKKK